MRALFKHFLLVFLSGFLSLYGEYPDQLINIVVPFAQPAGGAGETARTLAPLLARELGVAVNVIYKEGRQTGVGLQYIADSPPNGYTLGLATSNALGLKERGIQNIGLDDITPIALLSKYSNGFFVRTSLPIHDFKEFIEFMKKNPGELKVAGGIFGGIAHLEVVGIVKELGMDPNTAFKWIYTKDIDRAIEDLKGKRVDCIIPTLSEGAKLISAGDVRLIAVIAEQRDKNFPDVPTVKEVTGSSLVLQIWNGLVGPKNLPKPIVKKIEAAILKICNSPEGKKLFKTDHSECLDSEQFKATIIANQKIVQKILSEVKLKN